MALFFPRKSTLEDGWREALENKRNLIRSSYDSVPLSSTFYMSRVLLEVKIHDNKPSAHCMSPTT